MINSSRGMGRGLCSAATLAIISLTACASDNGIEPGTPVAITATSGSGQGGTVNTGLGNPLVVTVFDQNGQPLAGQTVTFASSANGLLGSTTAITDLNGQAQTTFSLGTTSGAQVVTASVGGVTTPASFTLNAAPGAATQLAVISGNNQAAVAGASLTNPFVVEARDVFGNPVPGTAVTFSTAGGGVFAGSPNVVTGTNGQALIGFQLPTSAGSFTSTASLAGLPGSAVTFTSVGS